MLLSIWALRFLKVRCLEHDFPHCKVTLQIRPGDSVFCKEGLTGVVLLGGLGSRAPLCLLLSLLGTRLLSCEVEGQLTGLCLPPFLLCLHLLFKRRQATELLHGGGGVRMGADVAHSLPILCLTSLW